MIIQFFTWLELNFAWARKPTLQRMLTTYHYTLEWKGKYTDKYYYLKYGLMSDSIREGKYPHPREKLKEK
ncbi:hypothetical protein HOU79_gp05 [Vibrio phage 1.224.A._10N.261.48.B1]|uniref:Uncharacterized protein n=1 Tax=Vibrio phage 1.224.A._10N.261.48.B1 TaxID=1881226 RepID=A0A2I7RRU5_9CAUD|nr:hypothetical protein HOU79_gp05 [Vibrio phage 1.224.A._10N.261.48.B1]AUR96372.1 hypothetical protein NVP1224A_05 [Vibrio phage 1.224.A._10N.261.48.B1]